MNRIYKNFTKPVFDRLFALFLLIIFLPIMVILYILVIIFLGYPAVFKQQRPGLNGKIFVIFKFKSIKDNQANMTLFGRILRYSSLDELPQLFNILFGQMSFIGPRPLLTEYLPLYSQSQLKRHDVLPGLSGLAQVRSRKNISWRHRLKYDTFYAEHISFKLDIMIFFYTFMALLNKNSKQEHYNGKN